MDDDIRQRWAHLAVVQSLLESSSARREAPLLLKQAKKSMQEGGDTRMFIEAHRGELATAELYMICQQAREALGAPMEDIFLLDENREQGLE